MVLREGVRCARVEGRIEISDRDFDVGDGKNRCAATEQDVHIAEELPDGEPVEWRKKRRESSQDQIAVAKSGRAWKKSCVGKVDVEFQSEDGAAECPGCRRQRVDDAAIE